MLESASLLSFYLAFALLHGAEPGRLPFDGWRSAAVPARTLRLGAVLCVALGVVIWAKTESTAAALLVAIAALSAVATLFVLLAPLCPRALWGIAASCPPLILVLSLLGVAHG